MLRAEHLTRRFEDRVAVDDVSFDVRPGEVLALLGPNGAGKTTTLRMLAGLIAASEGSVSVDGERLSPVNASRLRRRIGFLTETPGLWDTLTVRENLTVFARLYDLDHPAAAVDRALDRLGLRTRASDTAARLSKGLKQRAAIARALLHDPEILLFDEPTAGLDPESASAVRTLIARVRDEGCAVLLCTHNLDEAARLATRVAVLKQRLVAIGTPAALGDSGGPARVRVVVRGRADDAAAALRFSTALDVRSEGPALSIGRPGGHVDVPDLVRALVAAGADVESVTPEAASLEDAYLALVRDERPS